jgi:hypothetical protein
LFLFGAKAQSSTTNALSFYGLGERANGNHSIYDALGYNNFNYFDSSQLNFFNPASYCLMSTGNTLFSIGIQARESKYSYNGRSEYRLSAMADHFALGFKMKRNMGLSFGLKPFSSRGYSFSQSISTGTDSLKYSYTGSGGIEDLYLGFSLGIIQMKKTKLAIGVNASYLFGTVSNERQALLIDANTNSGGIGRQSVQIKSFHYELGTFFRQSIGKKQEFTLSGVFAPTQNLNAAYLNEFYTASNINTLSAYDTLDYTKTKGNIKYGFESKFGLSYQVILHDWKRKTRTLHPQLTVLASYVAIAGVTHNFDQVNEWTAVNSEKVGLGIQFAPEAKLYDNISTLKALEKLNYRIGIYQNKLPYQTVNGSRYIEQGLTFGLGMPIIAQQGLSSLNLALTLGNRGTAESNTTKESFIGLSFGLIVSPASFDRWFRKRKLD